MSTIDVKQHCALKASDGPSIPTPRKFSRSGSKESFASRASFDSAPLGVWSFASDVSTTASSPQRRSWLQGCKESKTSSTSSTPRGERILPEVSLLHSEQPEAFYMELLQKTSQLLQVRADELNNQSTTSPLPDDLDNVPDRYESLSLSRPRREQLSQPKWSPPISSPLGMETCGTHTDASVLVSTLDRGRSPKKGKKAKQQALLMDPLAMEGLPSRGSKNHVRGQCRPCIYFNTAKGCPNGILCNFCHCDHREKADAACCYKEHSGEETDSAAKKTPLLGTTSFRPPPGLPPPPPPGL